jgi:LmbE family N-acetylglucosaminyl deacetylase
MAERARGAVRLLRMHALRCLAQRARPVEMPTEGPSLIVAPHPDDEALGCAGWMARSVQSRQQVHVAYLTAGGASHRHCCGHDAVQVGAARQSLALEATGLLGVGPAGLHWLQGEDGAVPCPGQAGADPLVAELAQLVAGLRPAAVLCPHPAEGWPDHAAAARLVAAALTGTQVPVPLYHYCVWFWFSQPLGSALRLNWGRARLLELGVAAAAAKQAAVRAYLRGLAPCGRPWVGLLPSILARMAHWPYELYFAAAAQQQPRT